MADISSQVVHTSPVTHHCVSQTYASFQASYTNETECGSPAIEHALLGHQPFVSGPLLLCTYTIFILNAFLSSGESRIFPRSKVSRSLKLTLTSISCRLLEFVDLYLHAFCRVVVSPWGNFTFTLPFANRTITER